MKKLGVIGGAGPLASALFYDTIVREAYGLGLPIPEMVIINYPFTRGLTREEGQNNAQQIDRELTHCLEMLTLLRVDLGALICNTLHVYLHQYTHIPFVSLPELLMQGIHQHQRLLLLGTQNTCSSSLYRDARLTCVLPTVEQQQHIDRVIDRILTGRLLQHDALLITQIIQSYADHIDGVILGCTDLPVLHNTYPFDTDKMIYDSVVQPAKRLLGVL